MKLIMSIQLILLMAVLVTAVFSVGITTILMNPSYAQEQRFITSLTGDQEVPSSGSAKKVVPRSNQIMILCGIK